MARIRLTLGIGFAGAKHEEYIEIPDEELDGLDENETNSLLNDYWADWSSDYIDGGAEIVE